MSFHAFSHLDDHEWLAVLERSLNETVIDGVEFPGFPSIDMQVGSVGSSGKTTLLEAFAFYRHLKNAYAQHVGRLSAHAKILDFGIGWGRIIRFFLKDVATGGLHGVDVRSDFIELCRLARLPAKIIRTTPTGTLPYPKCFFDIVYAYSVFTHLPEDMQHLWLAEIARVLRPGGLFVATVQPPRFLDFCRSIDEKAAAESGWFAGLRNHVKSRTHLDEDLARDGIIYFPSGGGPALPSVTYGDIILSPNYIKNRWSTCFRVIEVLDDPSRFTQAVVTALKPVTLWGKLSAIFRNAPH